MVIKSFCDCHDYLNVGADNQRECTTLGEAVEGGSDNWDCIKR